MKICPKCGLTRQVLTGHIDSRICRAEQITANMWGYGFYPLSSLYYAKILRWAVLPCECIPARISSSGYMRSHRDWKGKRLIQPAPSYSGELYEGLSDMLFVNKWVATLLKDPTVPDPNISTNRRHGFKAFKPIINLLRAIQGRDEEYKLALMTTLALGGLQAVFDMIDTELL